MGGKRINSGFSFAPSCETSASKRSITRSNSAPRPYTPRTPIGMSRSASTRSSWNAAWTWHMGSALAKPDLHRGVLAEDAIVVHHDARTDGIAQVASQRELGVVAEPVDAADDHGAVHHVDHQGRAGELQVVHADGEAEVRVVLGIVIGERLRVFVERGGDLGLPA